MLGNHALKHPRSASTRLQICRCLLAIALPAAAIAQTLTPVQQHLFDDTNKARAEQGLAPLRWDATLAQAAQAHAELMAQQSQLEHQYTREPDLAARAAQAGAHFQTIAENIAIGGGVETVQHEWMKSPAHRANILDPNLDAVGFGAVERGSTLFAVADFDRSVATMTPDQVEETIGQLLVKRGVQLSGAKQDARQTCEMSHGSAGGSNPGFIMRWQSASLSMLPPELEQRLASHKYQTAAVGACSSANAEQGFTTYRIAVLLY